MRDMRVRQGSALKFTIETDDDTAESVTIVMRTQDEETTLNATEDFVNGAASFELGEGYTDNVETYNYQLNVNFATGLPDKYPDPATCEGEGCAFPTITVCEALDGGGES